MRSRLSPFIAFCIVWFASSALALTSEVSVRAQLSQHTAEVGSQVQLQVEVNGARSEAPPEIEVDGLDVQYVGPSTSHRVELINGQMKSETQTTHVFQIVPKREGNFTIPALPVTVDGRVYKTQPVALKVQKGSAPADAQGGEMKAFAEIDVKKKSAYVGEIVPVEMRLLVDARVRVEDVTNVPELTGDDFTMQRSPRRTQERETRNGQDYNVIVFRTAMTPTKAGKLTIGPCELPFIAQVTRPKRARSRSLFDSFFGEDFFDPFNSERRRFDAKAAAIEFEVKPLPVEGRPKDFSGAIGRFQFEAEGSPDRVKVGEPVTMKMRVTGDGNFDRVQAPMLVNPAGWKAYDASAKFDANDELKTSGTKTFEMPVVPEAKHEQMPQFAFSFFDPGLEKYVTLRSKPAPLFVQGEPLVAPAAPATTPVPAPAATVATDIAGLRYDAGPTRTFSPIYTRAGFWLAQGLAGLAALTLCANRWLRREPAKVRVAALRRERDELWRRLRSGGESADFYEQAAKLVQIETALAGGVEPASVDALVARRLARPDAETASGIDAIFEARAERLYAGAGTVSTAVSAGERERVLKTLERFHRP
jgi:hypothetical protein